MSDDLVHLGQQVLAGKLEVEAAVEQARAAAEAGAINAAAAEAADDQARAALAQGQAQEALVWAKLAVAAARAIPDGVVLAYALESVGQARRALGSLEPAAQAVREAQALFDGFGPESAAQVSHCQYTLGQIRQAQGRLEEAAELLQLALRVFQSLGLAGDVGRCQLTLGQICQTQGRLEEAAELVHLALRAFESLGQAVQVARCQYTLGEIRQDQGRLEEAAELLQLALRGFEALGLAPEVARCQYTLGQICQAQGRLKEAAELVQLALRAFESLGQARDVVRCQYTLGRIRLDQGRLEEAAELLQLALRAFESLGQAGDVASCQATLGQIRQAQGRLEEAAELLQLAQSASEAVGLAVQVARCQLVLGKIRQAQGRLEEAAELLQLAQSASEAVGLAAEVAQCQYTLGQIRQTQGRLDEAAELLQLARRGFEPLGRAGDLASCQHTLGQIRQTQGRLEEAAELVQLALRAFESLGQAVQVARCQYTLGQIRQEQGRPEEAAELLQLALRVFQSLGLAVDVGRCQLTLGRTRRAQGRLEEAARLLVLARRTFETLGLAGDLASCQYTLGQIRLQQGRLDEAAELVQLAQLAFETLGLAGDLASCQYTLGQIRRAQGRLDEAAELVQLAQPAFETLGLAGGLASCQYTLGQIRLQQGRLDEAAELVQLAQLAFETLGLAGDLASCQYMLGQIRRAQGRLDEAAELVQLAQPAFETLGLAGDLASCQHTLGQIRLQQGRLEEATRALLQARTANGAELRARDRELGWKAAFGLGQVTGEQLQPDTALNWLDEAIALLEQTRLGQPRRADRVRTSEEALDVYLAAATVALAEGQTERAYGYLLGAKARELLDQLGATNADLLLAGLRDPYRDQLHQLLQQAQALEQALLGPDLPVGLIGLSDTSGTRGAAVSPRPHTAMNPDLDEQLVRARQAVQTLLAQAEETGELPMGLPGGPRPSLLAIQNALPEHAVLLDLLLAQDAAVLFLVTRSSGCIAIPLGSEAGPLGDPAEVRDRLESLWHLVKPVQDRQQLAHQAQARDQRLRSELDALSDLVLGDRAVRKALVEHQVVLLSPPFAADALPWHALPWRPLTTPGQPAAPLQRLGGTAKVPVSFALLPNAALVPLLFAPSAAPSWRRRRARIVAVNPQPALAPIPYTRLEADWVQRVYAPHVEGHLLPEQTGSWEALRRPPTAGEATEYAVLHLCTHGDTLSLRLVAADGQEIRLDALAVLRGEVPVRAALVVLSACWVGQETGRVGPEWLGLASAFLSAAGAQAVVVCAWPVEDRAAPFFFRALHQAWVDGLPIGQAMTAARDALAKVRETDVAGAQQELATLQELAARRDKDGMATGVQAPGGIAGRWLAALRGKSGKPPAPVPELAGATREVRWPGSAAAPGAPSATPPAELVVRWGGADQQEVYLLIGNPTLTFKNPS